MGGGGGGGGGASEATGTLCLSLPLLFLPPAISLFTRLLRLRSRRQPHERRAHKHWCVCWRECPITLITFHAISAFTEELKSLLLSRLNTDCNFRQTQWKCGVQPIRFNHVWRNVILEDTRAERVDTGISYYAKRRVCTPRIWIYEACLWFQSD